MKKFKIVISGDVIESSWLSLTKKQYNYWKFKAPQALKYCKSFDSGEPTPNIDKPLLFLLSEEILSYSYLDVPTNELNQYGGIPENSVISIHEVDDEDNVKETLFYEIDFNEFLESFSSDIFSKKYSETSSKYLLELNKTYKGTFFVGYVYDEYFDGEKLNINILSNFNEFDSIDFITYDGEYINNDGDYIDLKSENIYFHHF